MKYLLTYFILLTVTILLFSCKKEGTDLSTETGYITKTWIVKEVEENGLDVTSSFLSEYIDYQVTFHADHNTSETWTDLSATNIGAGGYWAFDNAQNLLKDLEFSCHPFIISDWTINELNENSLIITSAEGSTFIAKVKITYEPL